jgi:YegS/Rv2252/BmrU family lipid kinase
MINSWFLIANPTSGNGKFSKKWKEIQLQLKINAIDFSFAFTHYSKHEIELVQDAIQKGFRNIISVGGDGTLHHVVNGIMTQRYVNSFDITVSVIPIGTGNDWIKTYNVPKDIKKNIKIIQQKNTISQDIGLLTLENNRIEYFNNVAGIGYDGYVVYKLKSLKKFGSISYLLSGLYGLLFYKKTIFNIKSKPIELKEKCLMTIFGICRYAGGGMQFTENVDSKNGLLDITVVKNLTFFELIFNLQKLYNGKITKLKKVKTFKTTNITVSPLKNKHSFIEADGELLGTGTVKVSIQPKAIHFVIP